MINNVKTAHDILAIQLCISTMENIFQQVEDMADVAGPSKPPPNDEAHDSNEDGTFISAPMFGLDDDNLDDVQKPPPSEDFIMVVDDVESSGSQHSTSKPKQYKKKTIKISRKEFLDLQAKVDQILAVVSSSTL